MKNTIILILFGAIFSGCERRARDVRGIPPGYDFPACRLRIERELYDVERMRIHAWRVFAGMTQEVSNGRAVFETWYPQAEAMQPQTSARLIPHWPPLLHKAHQLTLLKPHSESKENANGALPFDKIGVGPPMITVAFNRPAFCHIRCQRLYDKKHLLNDLLGHANAQDIPPFPNNAVAIKAVWWPLRREGLSVVPVWDNRPTRRPSNEPDPRYPPHRKCCNSYTTWERVVAINASQCASANPRTARVKYYDYDKEDPPFAFRYVDAPVLPLARIHAFKLTCRDVKYYRDHKLFGDFDQLFQDLYGVSGIEAGDYIALVALHVATKETEDWVWSTFWWHDQPNVGEFAADRPRGVRGSWRNYLMDIAVDTDLPRKPDRSENIAFNPWLEAAMPYGQTSNCMACHQKSAIPLDDPDNEGARVAWGRLSLNDPYYTGDANHFKKIRLDYMWSLASDRFKSSANSSHARARRAKH